MWPASGTWGSLPPVFALVAMGWLGASSGLMLFAITVLAIVSCIGCVHYGAAAERAVGGKDPGVVVIDEVAGMSVTLLVVLVYVTLMDPPPLVQSLAETLSLVLPSALLWSIAGAGFLFFRVMDVIKPPPAYQLQALRGGWGILVDDLIAGVYAGITTIVLLLLVVRYQPL